MYTEQQIISLISMPYLRMDLLTDIRRRLAVYVTDVQIANGRNLQDVNLYGESFISDLLNIIRSSSYVVINEFRDQNAPGIDIGDKDDRKYMQVTSTQSAAKIQHTIDKFSENYSKDYDQLYILLLRPGKPKYRKEFDLHGLKLFDQKKDILCIDDVYDEVSALSDEKLLSVHEYISKQISLDPAKEYTQEIYLLRNYFKRLSDEAPTDDEFEDETLSDLQIKRERFEKFWDSLSEIYTSIYDSELEKKFGQVFGSFSQGERNNLNKYLRFKSIHYLSEENDPIKALDRLKDHIIAEININLIAEIEVLNFIYYQMYRCNVFPNRVGVHAN